MLLTWLDQWSWQVFELAIYAGLGLLAFEIVRDLVTARFTKLKLLETLSSLGTQIPYYFTEAVVFGASVVAYYWLYQNVTPFQIPVTPWTIVLAVVAADFVYYWEHRLSHKVRLLWVAHAVHHSAPIMNTAVAFRFSPLDPLFPAVTHASLVLVGFDPLLVFFSQLLVLSYQTWIHTEVIGRLGPLDAVLNTPANHRVHHGADEKYRDKNFGGILMLWDRLFGTYQREEERPIYGLIEQIETQNPIKVWFSEVPGLLGDLARTRSVSEGCGYVLRPPGWRPAPSSPAP